MANITKRNENAPYYFEILYAGIQFLGLLEKNSKLSRIEIKPDRKYGANRRIEDLTKFHKDSLVEVIQIKHSIDADSKFGFSDLWTAKTRKKNIQKSMRKEGTNIYKFLKSWRTHNHKSKKIKLILASNKTPTNNLNSFLSDIKEINNGNLLWADFQQKYFDQITYIKSNCSRDPFKSEKELQNFITSFQFEKLPSLDKLEDNLADKLKGQGVLSEDRLNAYINRTNKAFISNNIEVLPQRVAELISRLKTGLLQEIVAPENYVERTNLENAILKAIETKKRKGGFVNLYAPSGSGKTVLLSQLSAKSEDFFPYFCRIRPFEAMKGKTGYSNINRLNSKWFKVDIIQRCFEFGLLQMTVGLEDDENFVDKMFDEALQTLSQNAQKRRSKKIVIIIDALDQIETEKYKGRSVLDAIPTVNYPGIVFLLSTWGPNYLPQSIKNLSRSLTLQAGIELYFTETEIKSYFNRAGLSLTQDHVAIIKNKTKGLAISLFYLINRLKNKKNIDHVIRSISKYSEVFDWYKPIWNSLNSRERNCLGYLCFHLASVKRGDLREMVKTLNIAEFNNLIKRIEHFLETTRGLLAPYHDSFRRFVIRKLNKDKKAYNLQIANYYSKNINLSYSKKYITQHLQKVGINHSKSRSIFERLYRKNFFEKLLRSNIDDNTKVEIGRSFVNYFYHTRNIQQLVHYSIVTSNIYPITNDTDVYEKAKIGTEKLIAQVDEELLSSDGNQPWQRGEWVFRRMEIGNILMKKRNKQCVNLAHRFIDDSLFRYSLNPDLLWSDDFSSQDRFWENVGIITHAMVNVQRYKDALYFVRKEIHFKKPTIRLKGFKAMFVAGIHIANLKINPSETELMILKSSKIERLLTYIEMEKQRIPIANKSDYYLLLNDQKLEKYFYNNGDSYQGLDIAEFLFVHKSRSYKSRILKLLNNIKPKLPYVNHGYIYWGVPQSKRDLFLRWIALQSLVNKKFNLNEYYSSSLKKEFPKSNKEKERDNQEFLNMLFVELELAKTRILLRSKQISWSRFWKSFESALKIFQGKINRIDTIRDYDYSDSLKTLLPYKDDMLNIIRDNLLESNLLFTSKSLYVLNRIEDIIGANLNKQATLLEVLIESTPNLSKVNKKVERYLCTAIDLRQRDQLDNTSKSDNLKLLATLAAKNGFSELAEKTFEKSLKYSRGIWNKGDLRFSNLVDSLRTKDKECFEIVLKYMYRIADVVEKTWYWKLDFLESAAYANFQMSLDYFYSFITKDDVNPNDGLKKIITTYVKWYPYNTIQNILPLLDLMDIKNESSYNIFENISETYCAVIKWSIKNNDMKKAQELILQYIRLVKKDIEPGERINILRDFASFLKPYSEMNRIRKKVEIQVKGLRSEGYSPVKKTGLESEIVEEEEIKKLKTLIEKSKIQALLKLLTEKAILDNYKTGKIITKLLPYFRYEDMQLIKKWWKKNQIIFEECKWLASFIKSASISKSTYSIRIARSEIMSFMKSKREYEKYRIIKELDKVDFPNKKRLIRKIMLMCIRELTGSSYYLPQFFIYTSDCIDKYFIELKEFSYDTWKTEFESSMRLSLSK